MQILMQIWGTLESTINPALKIMLLLLMVLDYATGMIAATYTGTLSSKIGFKGIMKKVQMFAVVFATAIMVVGFKSMDSAPAGIELLLTAVTGMYIVMEMLSILENVSQTGVPIPEKLKEFLDMYKREADEEGDPLV